MNRVEAPEFKQAQRLEVVFPERVEGANGMEIFLMKDVKDASVKIDVEWNAGTKFQKKKLVAGFTNKLLLSGTSSKSAEQITEEIDFYGGYVQKELDKDHAALTIYCLNENTSDVFKLVKEAINGAIFPENELNKELSISKSKFKINNEKVSTLCRRDFNKNLYGDAPYGAVAELDDFEQLKLDDLKHFYQTHYKTVPVVFVTGNISDEFLAELKTWGNDFSAPPVSIPKQIFNQYKGRIDIEKADAIQSAIRVGRLMFDKKHPDYFNFQLLNTVLGGYFGSRLMANIREDKGYTYGIGSGMAVLQDVGYFYIGTEVGKEVKENTLIEIYKELDALAAIEISEGELQKVKNYMLGEFLRQADGPNSQMENFKNIYFNNLDNAYYQLFIDAIHQATPADLMKVAQKYFKREEMLEVIAG
ncbi:MAG: pitrilysin family protein [Crocinitomicaceae bacterium]